MGEFVASHSDKVEIRKEKFLEKIMASGSEKEKRFSVMSKDMYNKLLLKSKRQRLLRRKHLCITGD